MPIWLADNCCVRRPCGTSDIEKEFSVDCASTVHQKGRRVWQTEPLISFVMTTVCVLQSHRLEILI
jgi:hypothetical protein